KCAYANGSSSAITSWWWSPARRSRSRRSWISNGMRRLRASETRSSRPCALSAISSRLIWRPARSASRTELRPYSVSRGSAFDAPGGVATGFVFDDHAEILHAHAEFVGIGEFLRCTKLAPRIEEFVDDLFHGQ